MDAVFKRKLIEEQAVNRQLSLALKLSVEAIEYAKQHFLSADEAEEVFSFLESEVNVRELLSENKDASALLKFVMRQSFYDGWNMCCNKCRHVLKNWHINCLDDIMAQIQEGAECPL